MAGHDGPSVSPASDTIVIGPALSASWTNPEEAV
jgi:hypothetical protein